MLPSVLGGIRRFLNSETLLVVSMGLCLGMAVFSVYCGFSLALGCLRHGFHPGGYELRRAHRARGVARSKTSSEPCFHLRGHDGAAGGSGAVLGTHTPAVGSGDSRA